MQSRHKFQDAISSTGTLVPYELGKGYNLPAGTWYVDCTAADSVNISVHCAWDANIVITSLNYESSNMPAYASASDPYADGSGAVDVANNTTDAAGLWIPQNPSTAYIPILGGTVTNATVAVAGGTAGGCSFELTQSDRRGRMRLVVTTLGYYRQHHHGKQA